MARKSLKEILKIPQLGFYLHSENCSNFMSNRNKASSLTLEIASQVTKATIGRINASEKKETSQFISFEMDMSDLDSGNSVNKFSDNISAKEQAEVTNEALIRNSKDINVTLFVLQLAFMSRYFLEQLERAQNGDETVRAEIEYMNGEIVEILGTNLYCTGINGEHRSYEQIVSDLAEGILISNQLLSEEKNPKIGIRGTYVEHGRWNTQKISMNYSIKDLREDAKNPYLLRYFSVDKIAELLEKRLLTKSTILKLFASESVDKNFAIEMMLRGILTQDEVLTKVFKKSNLSAVALEEKTSFKSLLLLYSTRKIRIDVLERGAKKFQEESLDLTEEIQAMSPYFDGDINKITELLTHSVFDYTNTHRFLDKLEADGKITPEKRRYIEKVVSDFKTNELLNGTENESLGSNGEEEGKKRTIEYVPGLNIDPDKRDSYFRSIGAVKKLKIRGETLIKDSDENVGKRNSLDGYELYIMPDIRIAALEKLYEVTRDKDGNVVYRRTKEGELIPAINNSTIFLPIEMAKDLAEKKNKSDLIKSPYVHRTFHTLGWVSNGQAKMREINPEIVFDAVNTKKWNDIIKSNFRQNMARREIR